MYRRWLGLTALAYVVAHHLGLLPQGLGAAPDGTQWADWIQLAVPVLVLAPAAMAMSAAVSDAREWMLFGIGCVVYTLGQGIHLAANSIDNASPGATAHLWDEIVGHLIWYAGAAVVLLALARTMPGRERCGALGYLLAVAVGLTWASNAVGGHTEVLSLAVAVAAVWFGSRHREGLGSALLVGFAPAVVALLLVLTPVL